MPNLNFGCKLSSVSQSWNEEQFSRYISNPVDRKSLATAATVILQELNREPEPVREIQKLREQTVETSREAEQKKEENLLEEPKKEAERKPRMMGKAR